MKPLEVYGYTAEEMTSERPAVAIALCADLPPNGCRAAVHVGLHLTPDQARTLSADLLVAADRAEGK